MSHRSGRLPACVITAAFASLALTAAVPRAVFADHIEETLIFDSLNNADNQDEGLVRPYIPHIKTAISLD